MSYLIYINGQQIETDAKVNFAQTKQVNDIANLTTRNSNYTTSVKIPRTANNIRIFETAFNVGSNSNFPYRKANASVIDSDTGQHVIYKGWCVLIESTKKEYSVTFYDGLIDFYKTIENSTITEIGVSELNHEKNIDNVIATWADETIPYRYILADYNGNNLIDFSKVNIDYQVPSAKVSFLWGKIFDFFGWQYEGTIFEHEKFQNLWLSYPKPASLETPIQNEVTSQDSTIQQNEVTYPSGNGLFYGSVQIANFFPNPTLFDNAYYNFLTGAQTAGLFRFSFTSGSFTLTSNTTVTTSRIKLSVVTGLNQFTNTYYVDIAQDNYVDIFLNVGSRVVLQLVYMNTDIPFNGQVSPNNVSYLTGQTTGTINFITGFSLGFDQAFIDYKVSDFVKEIMVRFGLTAFKNKYSNKIKFLTLNELLQGLEINDLSDKFISKNSEKYTFGNYAKKNNFLYKYNDDEMSHNNGSLNIDNQNLQDEVNLFQSQIFSPERLQSTFLGACNTYKIWDKEIKDDDTVTYKDLDGRFYFLRDEKINSSITVSSDILGGEETVSTYFRESYHRLKFNEILADFYAPISSLFNKAKLINCDFYLKPIDIYNFDFSKLVYISQLGSYYLVNKINNFVKGKPTKVELIEVDYFTEIEENNPQPDFIFDLGTPTVTSCVITLPIETNYEQPFNVIINVFKGEFNVVSELVYTQVNLLTPLIGTVSGGVVTFSANDLPYNVLGYKFSLTTEVNDSSFISFNSSLSDAIVLDGSCYTTPTYPSTLTLNTANYLGSFANFPFANNYRYSLNYGYTGITAGTNYILYVEFYSAFLSTPSDVVWQLFYFNKTAGETGEFNLTINVPAIYTQPTKFRLKIQAVTSNEITI